MRDNLHEISKLTFWGKNKNNISKLSSAEILPSMLSVRNNENQINKPLIEINIHKCNRVTRETDGFSPRATAPRGRVDKMERTTRILQSNKKQSYQIHFSQEVITISDRSGTIKRQGTKPDPVSILHKSITGHYRPVRIADGPITARYRFIKNASWEQTTMKAHSEQPQSPTRKVYHWIHRYRSANNKHYS